MLNGEMCVTIADGRGTDISSSMSKCVALLSCWLFKIGEKVLSYGLPILVGNTSHSSSLWRHLSQLSLTPSWLVSVPPHTLSMHMTFDNSRDHPVDPYSFPYHCLVPCVLRSCHLSIPNVATCRLRKMPCVPHARLVLKIVNCQRAPDIILIGLRFPWGVQICCQDHHAKSSLMEILHILMKSPSLDSVFSGRFEYVTRFDMENILK